MNTMKLNITKPAIQVAVTDIDGNVFFHTMTLEKAEILAKEIANTIHEMRTGKRADEVGFVFWNTHALPDFNRSVLVSIGNDHTDSETYYVRDLKDAPDGDVGVFELYSHDEITGWADFPEPVKNIVTADKWGEQE